MRSGGRLRRRPPGARVGVSGVLFLAGGLFTVLALARLGAYLAAAPVATLPGLAGEAALPTLLFIYRHEDCRTYAGLVEGWNELHGEGELRVRGVVLDAPEPAAAHEIRDVAGRGRPRFPVHPELADRAERLMLRLGFTRTPVAILLDAAGRPRLALPPEPDRERAERALAQARAHATLLTSGSTDDS